MCMHIYYTTVGRELRVELRIQGSQPSVLPLHYSQHQPSIGSLTLTSLDSQSSVQLGQLLAASLWLTLFESNEAHMSQSHGRKPLRQASMKHHIIFFVMKSAETMRLERIDAR